MKSRQFRDLSTALVLLLLSALWSCSKPYARPLVEPNDSEFKGVRDILEERKVARLVMIHGMCDHSCQLDNRTRWADENNQRTAKLLDLDYRDLREIYSTNRDGDVEV